MEASTRKRWHAAWASFWADVFSGIADDELDEFCDEADRQAAMNPDTFARRRADLDAALSAVAEDAPCEDATPEEISELDAWAETVSRVSKETGDGGNLTLWPHLLPSPPDECEGEWAFVRGVFHAAEPGSVTRAAASWPLYLFAFNAAVRRAAPGYTRAGVSGPVAQPPASGA